MSAVFLAAMLSQAALLSPRALHGTVRRPHRHAFPALSAAEPAPNEDSANLESALASEINRREASGDPALLRYHTKFHAMREMGPHHTTTPRQVVEHIITSLRGGNITQAFAFTCVPVGKRGTHKSSTDWSNRMAWEKASVINGAPSGLFYNRDAFESAVRSNCCCKLGTFDLR